MSNMQSESSAAVDTDLEEAAVYLDRELAKIRRSFNARLLPTGVNKHGVQKTQSDISLSGSSTDTAAAGNSDSLEAEGQGTDSTKNGLPATPKTYPVKHLQDLFEKELQAWSSMAIESPEYDRVSRSWPKRRGFCFRIITKDRVAFFVDKDIMEELWVCLTEHSGSSEEGQSRADINSEHDTDESNELNHYGPPLNLQRHAHGTESTVALMLDFFGCDKRADRPPGGWPNGWLHASKDVTITHALLLAHEMNLPVLQEWFMDVLRTQEADGRADYRRVFREAAVGGNAELSAYFAAKIWKSEWKEKKKIDVLQTFSVQEFAGIPAQYLWAVSQPLMVKKAGKRRPLAPSTTENKVAIEQHFKDALDSYHGELFNNSCRD